MKRLYTGPFSARLRHVWVERARKMPTEQWLWILPTRHLLQTVREMLLEGRGGLVDVPLLTFDDIAARLVKHVHRRTLFLNPYSREKLVEKLLERHADDPRLYVFQPILDQPGLARSLAHAIGEMKRSGLTEQAVASYLQRDRSDQPSARRQQALAFLFLRYQEALHLGDGNRTGVDPEELLLKACHILEGRHTLDHSLVDRLSFTDIHTLWVDHFTDFTPLQMRLLRSLVKASAEVGIYIPFPWEKGGQLPQLTAQLHETVRALEQWGLERVELSGRSQTAAREQLERDWLSGASTAPLAPPHLLERSGVTDGNEEGTACAPEGLECLPACTRKREIETVAKEIKRIVRAEGIAPSDIVIVVKDESYKPLIHDVMQRDGVPLYDHEQVGLHETAMARQLVSLLRLAVSDWERRDLICLAEGGYLRWQHRPPYGLETWVKKVGIDKGRTNWQNACKRELGRLEWLEQEAQGADWEPAERERRLKQLARQRQNVQRILAWFDELQQIEEAWASAASWSAFVKAVERMWDELDVEGCVKRVWSRHLKRGEVNGYRRDWDAYRTLCDTLQEMKEMEGLIPESSRTSRDAFVRELSALLSRKRVTVTFGHTGGVRLMDPSGVRGASFDTVFIIGLNEGSFPVHHAEDWLIRDAERVAFHGGQARLPASYAHNEMEQLFFEMAVCTARRRLILSYVSPEGNEEMLRSRFLDQLERQYATGPWLSPPRFKEAMESRLYAEEARDVTSPQEYRHWFMAKWAEGGEAFQQSLVQTDDPVYREERPALCQLVERAEIEQERYRPTYGRWDGHLLDPRIHARLRQEFSPDRTYSVSQLNDYAACPLHFFFSRVLGVEPLEETEQTLSPLDAGNVLHEVLRRLLASRLDRHMCDVPLEEWQATLRSVFQEVTATWEHEQAHALPPLWPLEKKRLSRMLEQWLQHEYKRQGRRRFKPRHVEFSFGLPRGREGVDRHSSEHPISLSLRGETLRLVGRIDRIDHDEDGHFVLYDYKLSTMRYEGCQNVEETTNFQLPLYVLAYRRWLEEQGRPGKPVGAGFYGLRAQDKYKKIGIWEEASLTDLGLGKLRSGVADDVVQVAETALERVADLLDGIRHGRFYMLPEHEPNPYYGDEALYRHQGIKR